MANQGQQNKLKARWFCCFLDWCKVLLWANKFHRSSWNVPISLQKNIAERQNQPKTWWHFHEYLWIPMLRSDDMEVRYGNVWCQTALNTRFWCAWTDWQGFWPWCLMSKMWITGSAEPDDTYQPSGDHDWLIRADWDSLFSCFQPNAWTSIFVSLTSNRRHPIEGAFATRIARASFVSSLSFRAS